MDKHIEAVQSIEEVVAAIETYDPNRDWVCLGQRQSAHSTRADRNERIYRAAANKKAFINAQVSSKYNRSHGSMGAVAFCMP